MFKIWTAAIVLIRKHSLDIAITEKKNTRFV